MGTGRPAWPGLGKSGDRWPLARQQAQNGGRSRRKGNWHGAERGQLDRSVGNWENWGHRVSGHPGTSPGIALKWGVRRQSQAPFASRSEGLGPNGNCAGDSAGHAGSHPVWALCPGPHTARQVQDGSLEALPQGSVVRQGSHMKSGQPQCLPSGGLPPPSCPSSWKTTEEIKWKHKSATQSLLLPQARPPHTLQSTHKGVQPQKRASPAWLVLARPSGYDRPSKTPCWACHPIWSHKPSPSPGGPGHQSLSPTLLPFPCNL